MSSEDHSSSEGDFSEPSSNEGDSAVEPDDATFNVKSDALNTAIEEVEGTAVTDDEGAASTKPVGVAVANNVKKSESSSFKPSVTRNNAANPTSKMADPEPKPAGKALTMVRRTKPGPASRKLPKMSHETESEEDDHDEDTHLGAIPVPPKVKMMKPGGANKVSKVSKTGESDVSSAVEDEPGEGQNVKPPAAAKPKGRKPGSALKKGIKETKAAESDGALDENRAEVEGSDEDEPSAAARLRKRKPGPARKTVQRSSKAADSKDGQSGEHHPGNATSDEEDVIKTKSRGRKPPTQNVKNPAKPKNAVKSKESQSAPKSKAGPSSKKEMKRTQAAAQDQEESDSETNVESVGASKPVVKGGKA